MQPDPDAFADMVVNTITAALAPLVARLAVLEAQQPRDGRDGLPGRDGAMGPAGEKGLDGRHGVDGVDGLGFDDLSIIHDGERSFTVRFARGETVKDVGTFTIKGLQIYRGVYADGHRYDEGDSVTWAGSTWHCNDATTTKPGDGSKAWTLMVKRGKDGRDGKDGA